MTERVRNEAFSEEDIGDDLSKLDDFASFDQQRRNHWVFRGMRCEQWPLMTSLERFAERWSDRDVSEMEASLVREFRRVYHHYSSDTLAEDNELQWRALMQHHGAPTRLLDFTYSIHLATYNALEYARGKASSAVWAINAEWAVEQTVNRLKEASKPDAADLKIRPDEHSYRLVNRLFFSPFGVRMACPLNPFRLNERLLIQRGLFMCPGTAQDTFEDNLLALPGAEKAENVCVLILPEGLRDEALRRLFHMNITRASLYPGLDGFATSLAVYHPTVVDPPSGE